MPAYVGRIGVLLSCVSEKPPLNGSAEMWPSGRRRSPAKGVGPEGSRGFESLRLRHPHFFLLFDQGLGGIFGEPFV